MPGRLHAPAVHRSQQVQARRLGVLESHQSRFIGIALGDGAHQPAVLRDHRV